MTKYFKLAFIIIVFIIVWYSLYYFSLNAIPLQTQEKIPESQLSSTGDVWAGENFWDLDIQEIQQDENESDDKYAEGLEKKYTLLKENEIYKRSIESWDNYFVENRLISALQKYQAAKKIVPNDKELDIKIADVYFELKRYESAFKYYKNNDAVAGFSKEKEVLALFYANYNLSEKDVESIKQEIKDLDFDEEEWVYYLNSLQCVLDFSKCKKYYQDYFALSPEREFELIELQRLKDGIDAYIGSGTDDLNFKNALIIWKFFENKHYAMVVNLWKDLLEDFPDYDPVIQMLAKSYYELGEYELAHNTLKPLHETKLSDAKIAYFMWIINLKRKFFLSSSIYFNKALEAWYEPKIEAKRKLVYNYFLIENKEKMYSMLNDLLYQDDVNEADFALGIHQALQDKKYDIALEYAKRWSVKFPESATFYSYIWDIYFKEGKVDLASEAIEKWKIIDPKNIAIVYYDGKVLMESKKYDEAFLAFKRVLSLSKGQWEYSVEAKKQLLLIQEFRNNEKKYEVWY